MCSGGSEPTRAAGFACTRLTIEIHSSDPAPQCSVKGNGDASPLPELASPLDRPDTKSNEQLRLAAAGFGRRFRSTGLGTFAAAGRTTGPRVSPKIMRYRCSTFAMANEVARLTHRR
jgi:hypothetical protein